MECRTLQPDTGTHTQYYLSHVSSSLCFYHAMHYSAKHGLAIACRLSVCPSVRLSVTLVDHDHIDWKYWKL